MDKSKCLEEAGNKYVISSLGNQKPLITQKRKGYTLKKDEGFWFGTAEFRTIEMPQCDIQLDESELCLT